MFTLNSFTGGAVRWLDDNSLGQAEPERDAKTGTWLGTFTVYTRNPVTGGTREDRGAVLGMHIVVATRAEREADLAADFERLREIDPEGCAECMDLLVQLAAKGATK